LSPEAVTGTTDGDGGDGADADNSVYDNGEYNANVGGVTVSVGASIAPNAATTASPPENPFAADMRASDSSGSDLSDYENDGASFLGVDVSSFLLEV
jgi:hypothetical protein